MQTHDLIYTVAEGIATITLNRPRSLNAISTQMRHEWIAALEAAQADDAVNVVILTGAGRAFCSGADPRELSTPEVEIETDLLCWRLIATVRKLEKPYIAAINGPAAGGGMDMAAVCDLRLCSDRAKFNPAYLRMGGVPAEGGAYLWPRIIGLPRSLELLWTSRVFDAEEAYGMGFVNRVVPHDQLMPATLELAGQLVRGPTVAIRLLKKELYETMGWDLDEAVRLSKHYVELTRQTQDLWEGPRAWLEKREPRFQGR
ncbi:MAG: enoyl-CoA hydratase/isomerase family protein [Chloroflexi bacterium]|nr:enoyl-CoA hydratase/isomerase family protein [Chloroflexota bacterium]